ncbi:tetratricopeptide repeat protein [Granulicella sp. WH15]|uniref:tetratricopeptide repeat protein n=1 Tax=Granulicella sp. WH15 TaxID=2602070 RepID=UPI0013A57BFF|nr:tetratricopeptide repeat protein [Granulicella sp. WH15]
MNKKEDEKTEQENALPIGEHEAGESFESMIPPVMVGQSAEPAPEHEAQAPAQPDVVRAFDQDGREVLVPRAEWREQVLPNLVQSAWENPEQLYLLIVNSLNEGFTSEMAAAAQQLYAIDTIPARGACMWAVILIQEGRLDEAEEILNGYLAKHGDEGSVLTNLAQIAAMRGNQEQAETTLWRAIQAEPNIDNALGWYVSLQQQKGGEAAANAALQTIATLPGSWRAQLWQARAAMLAQDMPTAVSLYQESLERAPRPVPGDLLMQMSGDLGGNGRLIELIGLTSPHFDPEVHGLPVGNNLIKANLDQGNADAAEQLVKTLAQFGRPDWKSGLEFWEQEIAKLRGAQGTAAAPDQIQVGMLRMEGPVWLPAGSPGRGLFGPKAAGGPTVTFIGGTAETSSQEAQVLDGPGRMSRALPLFLAEQVEMRTAANGRSMLPWAMGQQSGFVVGAAAWTPEMAVQGVAADGSGSQYVVTVHIDAAVEPWTAELVFIRTSDGVTIGELDAEFPSASPEDGLLGLANEVVELLGGDEPARGYSVPHSFSGYLSRLEQLLAARCTAMEGVPPSFLQGEREILEGNLYQYIEEPENLASRLLLVETFGAIERVRPAVAAEYRERLEKLLTERPLATS